MAAPRIACFFSTSGHSGVDRAARHLIPALAGRGYAVDLLRVRRHGPELSRIPPRVSVIDLGSAHTYGALPELVRYLKRVRPAVLLSDKDRVNRTALLGRFLARVPTRLVLSSGTTISIDLSTRGPLERWIQRNSMGKLYPFADAVIVNARQVAEDMADFTGLPRDRIQVVPNPAVPEALFHRECPVPDHPWFGPDEPPVILGVGELCTRKDFATLIRAFARVRAVRPCRLVILGEGSQRGRLRALAQKLGVASAVDLPGFQPNPYDYMAHSALFVLTSRWEGNPFVLPEALAVGTPVLATDCPSGPREVLDGGRYGLLVPVSDVQALAQGILQTLAQPLPKATLQEAARPFTIEAATDAYLRVFGLPLRAEAMP